MIRRRKPAGEAGERTRAGDWVDTLAVAVLVVMVALAVAMVFLQRSGSHQITGTWNGYDSVAGPVLYYFGPDGRGFRMSNGERQDLRFEVREGYPTLIRIRVDSGHHSAAYHGIARVTPSRLTLDLTRSDQPAPVQLSARALELHRPASR